MSVELEEVGNVVVDSLSSSSVGVEVGCLSEEVGTKSLVRVVEDSVLVGVSSGGSVLAENSTCQIMLAAFCPLQEAAFLDLAS